MCVFWDKAFNSVKRLFLLSSGIKAVRNWQSFQLKGEEHYFKGSNAHYFSGQNSYLKVLFCKERTLISVKWSINVLQII